MTNDLDFPCLQMQVFVHSNGSPVVAGALEQGVGRGGRERDGGPFHRSSRNNATGLKAFESRAGLFLSPKNILMTRLLSFPGRNWGRQCS